MEWVTGIATVLLTILTAMYVRLTHRMLTAQMAAFVSLSLDRDNEGMVSYALRNDGTGVARDVRVQLPTPFSVDKSQGSAGLFEDGPIGRGVPVLAPGRQVLQLWAHDHRLYALLGHERKTVKVSWKRLDGKEEEIEHEFGMFLLDPRRLAKAKEP